MCARFHRQHACAHSHGTDLPLATAVTVPAAQDVHCVPQDDVGLGVVVVEHGSGFDVFGLHTRLPVLGLKIVVCAKDRRHVRCGNVVSAGH